MTQPTVGVAIVDDQPLLVTALGALVNAQEDMTVLLTASNGGEALAGLEICRRRGQEVDVVLMDIRMPVLDGIATTRQLRAHASTGPDRGEAVPRVLVLTTFSEEELVLDALRAGASGFLLKDAEPSTLLAAIREVAGGRAWLDPAVTPYVLNLLDSDDDAPRTRPAPSRRSTPATAPTPSTHAARQTAPPGFLLPGEEMTRRESVVVELVCQGLSNAQIATRMNLAESTVKTHVKAVLGRTGCRNRVELIIRAFTTGLIRPDTPDRSDSPED